MKDFNSKFQKDYRIVGLSERELGIFKELQQWIKQESIRQDCGTIRFRGAEFRRFSSHDMFPSQLSNILDKLNKRRLIDVERVKHSEVYLTPLNLKPDNTPERPEEVRMISLERKMTTLLNKKGFDQVPSLDPVVDQLKEGLASVLLALGEVNSSIQENNDRLKRIEEQLLAKDDSKIIGILENIYENTKNIFGNSGVLPEKYNGTICETCARVPLATTVGSSTSPIGEVINTSPTEKTLLSFNNKKEKKINKKEKPQITPQEETPEEPQTSEKSFFFEAQGTSSQVTPQPKKQPKQKQTALIKGYSEEFLSLWDIHRNKAEKAKSASNYQKLISKGFSHEEIVLAVKRYNEETAEREVKYTKQLKTLLSFAEGTEIPVFSEYLERAQEELQRKERQHKEQQRRREEQQAKAEPTPEQRARSQEGLNRLKAHIYGLDAPSQSKPKPTPAPQEMDVDTVAATFGEDFRKLAEIRAKRLAGANASSGPVQNEVTSMLNSLKNAQTDSEFSRIFNSNNLCVVALPPEMEAMRTQPRI